MKLESLVGLGINDIPLELGRRTRIISPRESAVISSELKSQLDFLFKKASLRAFEKVDHTGIYTNEVKREQPKFGTIDSAGRWLVNSVKGCIPSLAAIPFITKGVPTEKGWYNATIYDDTYAFRYWHGTHWSEMGKDMHLLLPSTKSALKRLIRTVEDGAITKWRKVPLLLVFYEAAEEYESSKSQAGKVTELWEWNEGAPPKVGWYYASLSSFKHDTDHLRYWDGVFWSFGISRYQAEKDITPQNPRLSKGSIPLTSAQDTRDIVWNHKPVPDWLLASTP